MKDQSKKAGRRHELWICNIKFQKHLDKVKTVKKADCFFCGYFEN